MRKRHAGYILGTVLLWSVLLTACAERQDSLEGAQGQPVGGKEQPTGEQEPGEASPQPTASAEQGGGSLLAPRKSKITAEVTGLAETQEMLAEPLWEGYNAVNRPMSRAIEDTGSLFCVDEATGVVYFVNQNKDCFLYRIKDGETALAVALPANYVYVQDGAVYFMVYSYGKYELDGMADGDIFRYTPSDGQVECVYPLGRQTDASGYKMIVSKDGIYWNMTTQEERIVFQCLLFEGEEAKQDARFMSMSGWRDYVFWYLAEIVNGKEVSSWVLRHRDDGSYIAIPLQEPGQYCVLDDRLFCRYGKGVCFYDLVSGEEEVIDLSDLIASVEPNKKREEGAVSFRSAVVTEEGRYVWACDSKILYRYDRQTGRFLWYSCPDTVGLLRGLYTDGTDVYALYALGAGGTSALVRLDTTPGYRNEMEGTPAFQVEYLTE